MFSGGIERDQWHEIDYLLLITSLFPEMDSLSHCISPNLVFRRPNVGQKKEKEKKKNVRFGQTFF